MQQGKDKKCKTVDDLSAKQKMLAELLSDFTKKYSIKKLARMLKVGEDTIKRWKNIPVLQKLVYNLVWKEASKHSPEIIRAIISRAKSKFGASDSKTYIEKMEKMYMERTENMIEVDEIIIRLQKQEKSNAAENTQ
jgi:transposase